MDLTLVKFSMLSIFLCLIIAGLVMVASLLGLRGDTVGCGTFLGTSVLFTALMLLPNFRRFEGFGFKAEMVEQELHKAKEIVTQLEALSSLVIEQLAILSSAMGLASGGPKTADLESLLEKLISQCESLKYDISKTETVLAPLLARLSSTYCWEAEYHANKALEYMATASGDVDNSIDRTVVASTLEEIGQIRGLIRINPALYLDKVIYLLIDLRAGTPLMSTTISEIQSLKNRLSDIFKRQGQH